MYKISIKRNKVVVVSEKPFRVKKMPSKWETFKEVESTGACDYDLIRMLEKCEILAYKVEYTKDKVKGGK